MPDAQDVAQPWSREYAAAHEQSLYSLMHVAIFADVLRTDLEFQRCEPAPALMSSIAEASALAKAIMLDVMVAVRLRSPRLGASVEPAMRQVLADLAMAQEQRQSWGPH